jgi:hypothetical protein
MRKTITVYAEDFTRLQNSLIEIIRLATMWKARYEELQLVNRTLKDIITELLPNGPRQ